MRALPASVQRRKLNLKAKFESGLSRFSFDQSLKPSAVSPGSP
jgi:hypothetical protein